VFFGGSGGVGAAGAAAALEPGIFPSGLLGVSECVCVGTGG
jgi:hypothetical protein